MTPPAGYSGTPLAKKLGIKPESSFRLLAAPAGWPGEEFPSGSCSTDSPDADVTVAFYTSLGRLTADARRLAQELPDSAMLWIAWPRRAAGHTSDITENDLRDLFLPSGLVDVKVAALGEDWSGLKFVRRKELRSG